MTAQTPRERLEIRLRAHGGVLADAGLADLREHEAAVEAAARAAALRLGAESIEQEFHAGEPAETEREEAWNTAVRAAATTLRQMANETAAGQAPAPQPETCRHCGREIRDGSGSVSMDGRHREHWVHVPGGYATCLPHQISSPRATPAPQPETAPDAADRLTRQAAELGGCSTCWHGPHTGRCPFAFGGVECDCTWPAPAPDAEPGTPDDREQLREQYAAVLLDSAGRLHPRHVADPDALIRELLAVRDDALTTALAPLDSQDGGTR